MTDSVPYYDAYGVYEGLIVDNLDHDKLNRVKIRIPSIHGIDVQALDGRAGIPDSGLPWAQFSVPFYPMSFVPPIGTTVYVSFINGVLDRPVVIGCRANYRQTTGSDIPNDATINYPNTKCIETDKFVIYIDDTNSNLKIYSGEDYIELDAKNHVLNLNGDSAQMSSLVLGEKLVALFNGHIHPTGVGPSGTAMEGGTFLPSPMDNSASTSYPHLTRKAKTGP